MDWLFNDGVSYAAKNRVGVGRTDAVVGRPQKPRAVPLIAMYPIVVTCSEIPAAQHGDSLNQGTYASTACVEMQQG